VCEYALDTGTVVHGEVQADNGAVAPANDCYAGNIEVVKDGNGVAREVVVMEFGEVCVRATAFTTSADNFCQL
jgi:hypothetical protein